MLRQIFELFHSLTFEQRKTLASLQVLVVLMAIFEVVGVAAIGPFMSIAANSSVIDTNELLHSIYVVSGINTHSDFLLYFGVVILSIIVLSTVVSMITVWRLAIFASEVGTSLADRLFASYLKREWLFHTVNTSSVLTSKISTECLRITDFVLIPLLQMNAKIASIFFIGGFLIVFDPTIALSGLAIFVAAYFAMFMTVRVELDNNGKELSRVISDRFTQLNEAFGGIREILMFGRSDFYKLRFRKSGAKLTYARGTNHAISVVPRYFMELVAYGSMIALVLWSLGSESKAMSDLIAVMAVYALAALKLLPALQQVYGSMAQIRGNISSYEEIRDELIDQSGQMSLYLSEARSDSGTKIVLSDAILLDNVSFSYGDKQQVLNGLTMNIDAKSIVGIVGSSGSGKSTTVDILLGLLTPSKGSVVVDGHAIEPADLPAWRRSIGFVSQTIFLTEGSIRQNVAFGCYDDQIDDNRVAEAIRLSDLAGFVTSLPDGLDTRLGERGVRLSGGQRQRIGIARALYNEPTIIVFDEATSSLDGITEVSIMDAISSIAKNKTIIMITHRLKAAEKCDNIFMIGAGKVIDQGTYSELIERNEKFRKMALHI